MSGTGIRFHRDTITVIRAPLTGDRYGDQTRDWANATEHDVENCRLVPEASGEHIVLRDEVVHRWYLYAPADADVLTTDRIRYLDGVYEVNGGVRLWRSATGNLAHLECDLMRVEG